MPVSQPYAVFECRVAVGQEGFVGYKVLKLNLIENQRACDFSEEMRLQRIGLDQQFQQPHVHVQRRLYDRIFEDRPIRNECLFGLEKLLQIIEKVLH